MVRTLFCLSILYFAICSLSKICSSSFLNNFIGFKFDFACFMSGNNPAKLMELVGKFGSKLQNEVKNGNINPADLLKQTMSAAGGPQNLEKMMSDPKLKAKMSQMQQQQSQGQNATRDRLRAKLEKKK